MRCNQRLASLRLLGRSVGGALTLGLFSAAGIAQGADVPSDPSEVLQEVTVTAQKRSESGQKVPIALTAFGVDDLRDLHASDLSSLGSQITGVQVYTSIKLPSVTLRGVGLTDFASNYDSPVAVHVDEIYQSKPYLVSMPTYDIARVEALKGPQGTLFGRNATGGSLNYYTVEPTSERSGSANISYDQYNRMSVDGALNTPVGGGWNSRLSYYVGDGIGDAGPYYNLYTHEHFYAPRVSEGRFQLARKGESTSVRLFLFAGRDQSTNQPYRSPGIYSGPGTLCPQLLLGQVSQNPSLCLKFGGLSGNPAIEREPTGNKFYNQINPNDSDNSSRGGYIRIDRELGIGTLTWLTSYTDFRRREHENSDDTPILSTQTYYVDKLHETTTELRLVGERARWKYVFGAFYEHDGLSSRNSADLEDNPLGLLPPIAPRLGAEFRESLRSYSLFAHNDLELTEALTGTVGLRYTRDHTELNGSTFLGANDGVGFEQVITPVIPVDSATGQSRTDSNFSYRAGLNWKPNTTQMLYGSVSSGFRAGGYAVPFGGTISTFAPEKLTAYELGWKSRLFGDVLQLNAAGFYYTYKGVQAVVNIPTLSTLVPLTSNLGDARNFGTEVDLWWKPLRALDVKLGAAYLDAYISNSDKTVTTYSGTHPLEGKHLVNTPPWMTTGLVRYTIPAFKGTRLEFETDARWTAARYLQINNEAFSRAWSYTVVNANIALASDDDVWRVAIWGRNVFNKDYLTYINNISFFKIDIHGEPATFGVSASLRF